MPSRRNRRKARALYALIGEQQRYIAKHKLGAIEQLQAQVAATKAARAKGRLAP